MRRPVLLALALLLPVAGAAQSTDAGAMACPAPRSYDTCAVRLDPSFWSGVRVVRGAAGTEVGRIRGFGGSSLAGLLAGSDSAVAHARRYTTEARRSAAFGIVAGVLIGAAFSYDLGESEWELSDAGTGLLIGGAIASIPAGIYQLRAQRELGKAVWWYNRDVAMGSH